MKLKSIRTKLTLILFLIALIPLLIVITFYLLNNISTSIETSKAEGGLRNSIVNEHLTEHFERTLAVLRTVARNPLTQDYILASKESRSPLMQQTINQTNDVFNDTDNMILTDQYGDQLVRSDTFPLINVEHRRYFHEAMQGDEYISDVLISLANNRLITVLEVPVFDKNNATIGVVQRDYDLEALQRYVLDLTTPHTRVMITDSLGNLVAYSEKKVETNELVGMSTNPAVAAGLAGKTGSLDAKIAVYGSNKKERMLLSYSRNELSGWVIITEKSYRYIWQEVILDAVTAAAIGGIMLFILAFVCAIVAEKATRKIRMISSLVDRAANGDVASISIEELGNDELGKMAMAINKIRSSRDIYQKEAEIDKLTGLLNKATFERLCRGTLSANQSGVFSALIVIDLDHFKEVNDTLGHQTGDALLHDFGEVLRRLFRPTDPIGRFGGDEFVVFLNDLPGKEIAIQKAKRIAEAASSILTAQTPIKVSASIGISTTPLHGIDYDTLFSVADKAVYTVKQAGRNGVSYGSDAVIR